MDPASEEIIEDIRKGVSKPRSKDRTKEDAAKEKLCIQDGNIGLPSGNAFACLVNAGRQLRYQGRTNISTADSSLLPALLSIEEGFLPFIYKNGPKWDAAEEWKPDVRAGRNKKGELIPLVRPRFDHWGFELTIQIDESLISPETARKLFDIAGQFYRLGGHRKKGPFGKFKVSEWKELEND